MIKIILRIPKDGVWLGSPEFFEIDSDEELSWGSSASSSVPPCQMTVSFSTKQVISHLISVYAHICLRELIRLNGKNRKTVNRHDVAVNQHAVEKQHGEYDTFDSNDFKKHDFYPGNILNLEDFKIKNPF